MRTKKIEGPNMSGGSKRQLGPPMSRANLGIWSSINCHDGGTSFFYASFMHNLVGISLTIQPMSAPNAQSVYMLELVV